MINRKEVSKNLSVVRNFLRDFLYVCLFIFCGLWGIMMFFSIGQQIANHLYFARHIHSSIIEWVFLFFFICLIFVYRTKSFANLVVFFFVFEVVGRICLGYVDPGYWEPRLCYPAKDTETKRKYADISKNCCFHAGGEWLFFEAKCIYPEDTLPDTTNWRRAAYDKRVIYTRPDYDKDAVPWEDK